MLLYTTSGCHLCEQALDLLHQAQRAGHELEVCEVEIAESESLMAAYGIRIPVVKVDGTERELGWPFDYGALERLIKEN